MADIETGHGGEVCNMKKQALRRLGKELRDFEKEGHSQILMKQSSADSLDVHFVFHNFSSDSVYFGGCYHGILGFPKEYPYQPPSIKMLTPNGRFETNTTICTSLSSWHPEEWSPACTAITLLDGLLCYFQDDSGSGLGTCKKVDSAERHKCAEASWAFNRSDSKFTAIFPELLAPGKVEETSEPASSSRAEPETSVEAPMCWFCLDESPEDPLIYPCECSGTGGGVHHKCLQNFVEYRVSRGMENPLNCRVCRQKYEGLEVCTTDLGMRPLTRLRAFASILSLYFSVMALVFVLFMDGWFTGRTSRLMATALASVVLLISAANIVILVKRYGDIKFASQKVNAIIIHPEMMHTPPMPFHKPVAKNLIIDMEQKERETQELSAQVGKMEELLSRSSSVAHDEEPDLEAGTGAGTGVVLNL